MRALKSPVTAFFFMRAFKSPFSVLLRYEH
jgi:hypothetical protein